jgi:3-isopropylmalate/(R)-2-methylmalate dehydratase large subunit
MAQTLAQKLVARAAGRAAVSPGEIVVCRVDLAMFHDSSGPRRLAPMLARLGAKPWDVSRIVLVTDHYVTGKDDESRAIVGLARDWAKAEGIRKFHDGVGICHIVLAENGYLRPGMFAVGADSHSPTGGAFGAYMFGIGATEMLGVVVTGEIWLRVPETIRMDWDGRLGDGVCAKDVMLFLCGRFGLDGGAYQVVEFAGTAIAALPMQERMTLTNMTAELGGQTGLVAPDETTRRYLAAAGAGDVDIEPWHSDPAAPLRARHAFDAAALAPQVAAPHSPANARPVTDFADAAIDVAYIGACTGAKLEDLRMAARVLAGRRVAAGVALLVAPASHRDQAAARAEGTLGALEQAGARLLPSACGFCAGYGGGFAPQARVVSTTARNFKGRMGDPSVQVYLASPYTVAASAVAGRIEDPRELVH